MSNLEVKITGGTLKLSAEFVADDVMPTPTPTPTPTPVPPTPTPLPGAVYTLVPKNMTLQPNGFYRSNDLGNDEACYVQARLTTAAKPGQIVRFTYQQKTNILKDGKYNIKDSRNWPSPSQTYPNDYTGRGIGAGADQITAENGDGSVRYQKSNPTNWTTAYYDPGFKPDVVQTVVREYVYADPGKSNGSVKVTVDGVVRFDETGWAAQGPRADFGPQMVYANPGTAGGFPSGAYYEARIVSLTVTP